MTIVSKSLKLRSNRENDIIDITDNISELVKESGIKNGIVVVFVVGSTAAITTIEYEPGLISDFSDMLARLIPKNIRYSHDDTWHDGNGHSHVRSSLLGPSIAIPIRGENLTLGTWQQIVLIEMDTRPRNREIIVQIIGE